MAATRCAIRLGSKFSRVHCAAPVDSYRRFGQRFAYRQMPYFGNLDDLYKRQLPIRQKLQEKQHIDEKELDELLDFSELKKQLAEARSMLTERRTEADRARVYVYGFKALSYIVAAFSMGFNVSILYLK